MYKKMRAVGFAALLFILTAVAIATPQSALAENPQYCDSDIGELTNSDFGSEVPVILVHGLSGGNDDWGLVDDAGSFAGHINDIPDVEVAHIYNYDTLAWWAGSSDAGPRLARTIDCIARLSENNDGYGKVIIVGYSQGGLVAREAVSLQSSDGQRAIADQVGQVVTIGTPHNIGDIPNFPTLLTVHTIAGDVTKVYRDIMGNELRREPQSGDLTVDINSAHAARTPNEIEGGGQKTFACEKTYVKKPGWPDWGWLPESFVYNTSPASCEHSQLIVNADNGVREDAAQAISRYVATLSPTIPQLPSLTIGSLTTYFDERWHNPHYSDAFGPGLDGGARDTTNGAPCTNCEVTPVPTSYAFVQIFGYYGDPGWCSEPILSCAVGSQPVIGSAPEVTIGGRTPDISARYEESGGYEGTALVWCFEDEDLCIYCRRAVDAPQLEPSQALFDLFETATWSN